MRARRSPFASAAAATTKPKQRVNKPSRILEHAFYAAIKSRPTIKTAAAITGTLGEIVIAICGNPQTGRIAARGNARSVAFETRPQAAITLHEPFALARFADHSRFSAVIRSTARACERRPVETLLVSDKDVAEPFVFFLAKHLDNHGQRHGLLAFGEIEAAHSRCSAGIPHLKAPVPIWKFLIGAIRRIAETGAVSRMTEVVVAPVACLHSIRRSPN